MPIAVVFSIAKIHNNLDNLMKAVYEDTYNGVFSTSRRQGSSRKDDGLEEPRSTILNKIRQLEKA